MDVFRSNVEDIFSVLRAILPVAIMCDDILVLLLAEIIVQTLLE